MPKSSSWQMCAQEWIEGYPASGILPFKSWSEEDKLNYVKNLGDKKRKQFAVKFSKRKTLGTEVDRFKDKIALFIDYYSPLLLSSTPQKKFVENDLLPLIRIEQRNKWLIKLKK